MEVFGKFRLLRWSVLSLLVMAGILSFPRGTEAGPLTWTGRAAAPTEFSHGAAGVVDNKLYVLGGVTAAGATAAVEMYDPAGDVWQSKPAMMEPRFDGGEAIEGGTVYIAGGQGAAGAESSILEYNTSDGTSSIIGHLATPRTKASAVVLDNKLYVVGGGTGIFDSIEEFDLSTKTGITRTLLPAARQMPSAVALGGKIYIIGGLDSNGAATSTCWVYDPLANSFAVKSPMPVAATGKTAVIHNGKIYIVGGMTASTPSPAWTSVIQEYDPVTDKWKTIGSFLTSRYAPAVAVSAGILYVIGGDDSPQAPHYLAVTETASLSPAGTVWGLNPSVNYEPLPVSGIDEVIAISAGAEHALALKSDGTVWSWGYNGFGELGREGDPSVPGQVSVVSDITAIAGGGGFSAALKRDGTVWKWGYEGFNGNSTPVQVNDLYGVAAIAASSGHGTTLALTGEGTVYSWYYYYPPALVNGISSATAVSRGVSHSLALKTDGTVWSWGINNDNGRLGRTGDPAVPGPVPGLNGVTAIAAGDYHSVALKGDGTVWTWGGDWNNGYAVPWQANGLTGVVAVAAGYNKTLALKADGTVWLVGISPETMPRQMTEVSGVTAIAASGWGLLALIPTTATPAIVNAALPFGTVGGTYQQTLAATGGAGYYSWSIDSGALPAGLSLNSATGVISGTPTAAGTANLSVRVTDATGATVAKTFSIAVYDPLVITAQVFPPATTGVYYGQPVSVTGGLQPHTWLISSGSLPPGLTLNVSTGEISGTPTATGTYSFWVQVTDAVSPLVSKGFSISVYDPLTITTASLPVGYVRNPYNPNNDRKLSASGGKTGYTWSISSGALPVGMWLDGATGLLLGIPVKAGVFDFTAQVTDSNGNSASKSLQITVKMAAGAVWSWSWNGWTNEFTPATPVAGIEGVIAIAEGSEHRVALKHDGTVWTWGENSGNQLGREGYGGALSTPGAIEEVAGAVAIAAGSIHTTVLTGDGTVREYGNCWETRRIFSATGFVALSGGNNHTVALKEDGTVWTWWYHESPAQVNGLTDVIAVASGISYQNNPTDLALKADGTVWAWDVDSRIPAQVAGLTGVTAIASGDRCACLREDGTVWIWTPGAAPAMVAGLADIVAISDSTAVKNDGTVWDFSIPAQPVQIIDVTGASSATQGTALVPYTVPTLIPSTLPYGTTGAPYSQTFSVFGGAPPYTLTSGSLPPGLTFANSVITGTPVAAGSYPFSLQAADSLGAQTTTDFTMVVYDPLVITTEALPATGVSRWYLSEVTASGGLEPYNWTLVTWNSLPAGLTLNYEWGYISGIPSAAGTSYFTVRVQDANGNTATKALSIFVLGITTATLPNGQVGALYSQTLTANNSSTFPITWSVTSGTLPPGLLLDPPTGLLLGTPTTAGSYSFTVKASDGGSAEAYKAFTVTIAAVSQPSGYRWSGIGPFGGNIQAIAIDSATPATLYAGTYGSGVFKSVDGGGTWNAAGAGLSNPYVRSVAIDPTMPARLYAGTADGVFKSLDGGGTWGKVSGGLSSYTNVTALAIDPTSPATIHAGTYSGVYKSVNGGGSWSRVLAYPEVTSLVMDPVNPAVLYAGTSYSGIYKSTDGGANWSEANTGLPMDYDYGMPVSSVAIDPVTPGALYAAVSGALCRSTNGGASWSTINTGIANAYVHKVTVDPTAPGTIYIISSGSIYKSTNGGANWSAVTTGVSGAYVQVMAIDPATPATLYAGVGNEGGIFKSTNGGGNWSAANSGLTNTTVYALAADSATGAIYGGTTYGGVVRSSAGGVLTPYGTPLPSTVTALAMDAASATLYATSYPGVYKSAAGGAWSAINNGLSGYGAYSLTIDPATSPATLYVSTENGLYTSSNGGGNWSADNSGFPVYPYSRVYALAVAPTTPATVYAAWSGGDDFGDYEAGVYKRTGSGSWTKLNSGTTYFYVNALATDPAGTTVYAGTNGTGVFKSTDGGPWTAVNSGLTDLRVTSLVVDPAAPSTIYAGTSGGVFKSTNGGSSWTPFNAGLAVTNVVRLALDAENGMLYAGTYGGGAFRIPTGLFIATTELPFATNGSAYSQTLNAAGGVPSFTWTITAGALPPGLALDGPTGVISGTPTAAGNFSFTVKVTDANSFTTTKPLSITVHDPLVITTASLPASDGGPYDQTLTATGGKTPYTWAIIEGSLPPGLTLNASTGEISGTPSSTGNFPFTVRVTDANGTTCPKSLHIIVGFPLVRIARTSEVFFDSLQAAYDSAINEDLIQIQALLFAGNLDLNRNISVSVIGGYDGTYSANGLHTTIDGAMRVSNGTARVESLRFR